MMSPKTDLHVEAGTEHAALHSLQGEAAATQGGLGTQHQHSPPTTPPAKKTVDLNHRPQEVQFDLSEVAVREFDAMVLAGREQAELALMGAGFLGGATTSMISLWLLLSIFGILALVITSFIQVQDPPPDSGGHAGIISHGELMIFFYLGIVGQAAWQCAFFALGLLRAYFLARRMFRKAYWAMVLTLPVISVGLFLWTLSNVVTFTFQPDVIRGYCSPNEDSCSDVAIQNAAIADGIAKIFLVICCFLMAKSAAALAEESTYLASESTRMVYVAGAVSMILQGVEDLYLGNVPSSTFFFLGSVAFLAVYAYTTSRKTRTARRANRIIEGDCAAYDHVWSKEIAASPANRALLAELHAVVTAIDITWKTDDVEGGALAVMQTRDRLRQASSAANTDKPRQCLSDLAVLFGQAKTLNHHFQANVNAWAQNVPGAHPKEVQIKRRSRAIQKSFRSYAGDASRLVDLVRSAITFDTLGGLVETLKRIRDDPRVLILQVKNRLALDFDSRESAGYRNVALNLVVIDGETMPEGIDAHVCELQLGVAPIDAIKNDEGHRRYVRWRDTVAE